MIFIKKEMIASDTILLYFTGVPKCPWYQNRAPRWRTRVARSPRKGGSSRGAWSLSNRKAPIRIFTPIAIKFVVLIYFALGAFFMGGTYPGVGKVRVGNNQVCKFSDGNKQCGKCPVGKCPDRKTVNLTLHKNDVWHVSVLFRRVNCQYYPFILSSSDVTWIIYPWYPYMIRQNAFIMYICTINDVWHASCLRVVVASAYYTRSGDCAVCVIQLAKRCCYQSLDTLATVGANQSETPIHSTRHLSGYTKNCVEYFGLCNILLLIHYN